MRSRRIFTSTIFAALIACLCCGLAFLAGAFTPSASAQKDEAVAQGGKGGSGGGGACSVRSLRGTYEIEFSGHFVGVGPVATLGTITLDGNGNFNITDTASFGGTILTRVGSGTYNVESNCTGSATVTYTVGQPGRQATFNLVVTDNGRDVRLIGTTPGSIVLGSAKPL
ncbi:MAG TPA: hypothetical protein VGW12_04975 [Pyrinomonadaceae bacterium]|nr:hypothetical protein [Pyrinomonadaceae bacterium]